MRLALSDVFLVIGVVAASWTLAPIQSRHEVDIDDLIVANKGLLILVRLFFLDQYPVLFLYKVALLLQSLVHLPLLPSHRLNVVEDRLALVLVFKDFLVYLLKHLLEIRNLPPQVFANILTLADHFLSDLDLLVRLLSLVLPDNFGSLQLRHVLQSLLPRIRQLVLLVIEGIFLVQSLSFEHLQQLVVRHQSIALVANSVRLLIELAQATLRLAAVFADGLAAPAAVLLGEHFKVAVCLATQHAEAGVMLQD